MIFEPHLFVRSCRVPFSNVAGSALALAADVITQASITTRTLQGAVDAE